MTKLFSWDFHYGNHYFNAKIVGVTLEEARHLARACGLPLPNKRSRMLISQHERSLKPGRIYWTDIEEEFGYHELDSFEGIERYVAAWRRDVQHGSDV